MIIIIIKKLKIILETPLKSDIFCEIILIEIDNVDVLEISEYLLS